MTDQASQGNLPIGRGLRGRCPRCGEGHLFPGLSWRCVRPASAAGLTTALPTPATGPAVFVILIGGGIVVFAALITEMLVSAAVLAARIAVAAVDL